MKRIFFVVTAIIIGSYAQAQDSTIKTLDEAVVTATKYPVKLSETGKVITVITHQEIERSSGKDLAQLLGEQTGIIVNGSTSNPGKDKAVFLRGASNDYTLILLDGIPVNDPTGVGGAFDLRLLPLNQVERIEIVKGSQSTLYGSDAVAGVINIITRKTGKKPVAFNGGTSFGSYNTFNGNAGLSGHHSILDYSVGYNYTSTDGISEATDESGTGNFDKDGFKRHSFQGNLAFQAGKNVRIMPFYRYTSYKGDYDADAFTDGSNKFTSLLNNTGLNVNFKLPKGTITANYGYTYAKRNYESAFGAYGYRGRFHSAEIYLAQPLGKFVKLLAGVNYQQYQLLDTTLTPKNPHTSFISPYASLFFQTNIGLNIEAGARYNHHSKFGDNTTFSLNNAYHITKALKLFANISTGFKAPTVTELFGSFGANPDLKPEKSTNFEGGAQLNIDQKKLLITATGFKRDIKDLIAYINGGLVNVDKQKDKGVELEIAYNPIEKLSLKASWTYVTGEITQSRNGKDTSFYNLIRRPKHAFTFNAGYQATKQLYASIGVQSLGKRTDLFFQPVPPYGTVQVNLKSYALLNVYVEYKLLSGKLRIFADAKNLTDTKYTEVYGYNTLGVNIIAGVNVQL